MSAAEHVTWEYRRTGLLSEPELNELGGDGWELTGVSTGELFFKRPRLSFKERVTLEQRERYYATINAAPLGDNLP
jgi:hypothetical protein